MVKHMRHPSMHTIPSAEQPAEKKFRPTDETVAIYEQHDAVMDEIERCKSSPRNHAQAVLFSNQTPAATPTEEQSNNRGVDPMALIAALEALVLEQNTAGECPPAPTARTFADRKREYADKENIHPAEKTAQNGFCRQLMKQRSAPPALGILAARN